MMMMNNMNMNNMNMMMGMPMGGGRGSNMSGGSREDDDRRREKEARDDEDSGRRERKQRRPQLFGGFDPMDPNPETNPLYNEKLGGAYASVKGKKDEDGEPLNNVVGPTMPSSSPHPSHPPSSIITNAAPVPASASPSPSSNSNSQQSNGPVKPTIKAMRGLPGPPTATPSASHKLIPSSLLVRNRQLQAQPRGPPKKPVRSRARNTAPDVDGEARGGRRREPERGPQSKPKGKPTSTTQAAYETFMKEIESLGGL